MKKLAVLLILTGLIGCSVKQPDPTVVTVNKKDLYQLTYEWAMYREMAAILYAKYHSVTKEQAKEHLEAGINDAVEKQFLSWYENREKWEKK
jgi:hypothetical protein